MPSLSILARPVTLALALAVLAPALGCAGQPQFRPHAPSVTSELVRVEFLEQDEDIFKFMVYSRSNQPMVILRDKVFLLLDGQRIARNPGGLKSTYDLPPGGTHDVNVAYDLEHLREAGEFSISFETAIAKNGEPIAGPVVHFSRATD